jgi:hypothetical protein
MFREPSNGAFRVVIARAAALLLATTAATQAASDRIIGEEDSPPPFLTGFVPFDITVPETIPETSITLPIGTATFPIVNGPAFFSSSVLLREPDQAISDVLTLAATRTGTTAGATIYSIILDFISDSEGGPVIDPPGGFLASVQETGALQDVTDLLFAPLTDRTGIVPTIGFLVQSDIPEPGTLSLLGAALLGLAWTVWRRQRDPRQESGVVSTRVPRSGLRPADP